MKSRFVKMFRRKIVRSETNFDLGSTEAEPRLVRKPAKKFVRTPRRRRRLQRSESLSASGIPGTGGGGGGGGGGSRRRRPTHYAPFASRLSRLGRQLSQAVDDRDSAKVRQILESVGDAADELEDVDGMLHSACENRDLATTAVLLRYGASPNTMPGSRDCAPIHIAVRKNCLGIASLLLSHGSYPNVGSKFEKRTPLHIASTLGSSEMVSFLLENNAKVDQGDIYGSTALHMAARMGHVAVTRALLDGGAGVDVYNNDGWTALHLAAESGNIAVVRLLLERNAFVDGQTRFGRTPLQWASTRGHLQVVEVLLDHRAKATISDVNGRTAIDHAVNDGVRAALAAAAAAAGGGGGGGEDGTTTGGRSRAPSTIGRLVNIDSRSRKELCSSGHISRQTLAQEEEKEDRRRRRGGGGGGGGENHLRRRLEAGGGVASVLKQDLQHSLQCRHYSSSWADCRSTDADSGRGSSRASSSVGGTLNRSKDGGSLARHSELRGPSLLLLLDGSADWDDGGGGADSLEHLAAVPEVAAAEDARKREAETGSPAVPSKQSLSRCRSQLKKLRDVFQLRTLTLERGMGMVVKETNAALDDGSLRSMRNALRSTRSAVQSMQSVVDEFRIQFDARLSIAERDISAFVSTGDHLPPPDPFHVFFHFLVSHVARYMDGWSRLIQGLCLPIDWECEVLRAVTKAAAAAVSEGPRRLSRSTGDMVGPLGDHDGGLVVDLSVCAVSCVHRHLTEVGRVKEVVRRILELMNDVFEDDSFRVVVKNFVRLLSSINAYGDISADFFDDYCAMVVKILGQSSTFSASELSTRLPSSEWNAISPADPSGHDVTGTSVYDVMMTWKRKVTTGEGESRVLDGITDLLVALIDLGREDLVSRYWTAALNRRLAPNISGL